jgi:hypothetical protein
VERVCDEQNLALGRLIMQPWMFDSPVPCGRWLPFVLVVAALSAPSGASAGQGAEIKAAPAAPQVQEQDVRSLSEEAPVKKWKPGDPVRVVPDLREDGEAEMGEAGTEGKPLQPVVRGPVAPQVMERRVNELSKVKPYRKGDPVRVVPDLKESNSTD